MLSLTRQNVVDLIITDLCAFARDDHARTFRLIDLALDVGSKTLRPGRRRTFT